MAATPWDEIQWEDLPSLRDVLDEGERQSLFVHKLKQCKERIDFSDPNSEFERKELKRRTLVELVDYVNSASGVFTLEVYEPLTDMVSANLFRALPVSNTCDDFNDPEDEDPQLEPAWQHIQIVYELFRRFIVSPETDPKVVKEYINEAFVLQLLDLFDSEDPREREYLKTILHRIYGKIMPLRSFIRKSITYVFYHYVYEVQNFNGVAELLEILGSVINGFALPLKEEHKQFLRKSLVPLHIPKGLPSYFVQLSFCVTQFVEKDASLAVDVIRGLCKYWPASHSRKEIMFLNELEELLELVNPNEVSSILELLFKKITSCISSQHFQVAERALFFWNNEYIVNLIVHHREVVVPIVFPALQRNAEGHWNKNVYALSFNVQKLLGEMDSQLFQRCLYKYEEDQRKRASEERRRQANWDAVTRLVNASCPPKSPAPEDKSEIPEDRRTAEVVSGNKPLRSPRENGVDRTGNHHFGLSPVAEDWHLEIGERLSELTCESSTDQGTTDAGRSTNAVAEGNASRSTPEADGESHDSANEDDGGNHHLHKPIDVPSRDSWAQRMQR
mmetsp:Transcript_5427/g.16194  ORF Transcript_5427/g.16194 Transcript_5427/m.16194 type:complete len:561 (-) Transcript_5427:1324-3006(-)|eukprot:CAMPEP_0198727470 /NCGR_PEP_ID=MMETSP1475-20131203/4192_1 /TAXON_ID= ORGANISM="Unidentified sp., Strain CCMP1999" /NCGR_SAMPLE_ID=MMETSP1475 /ASSEMBLY_ACC=CAM_ASM_001111 /LENGTH=560 /DNA_ID=CAMNT_0044489511 /DNA_START=218 /DNA_END=1900 /DNA_ORIENTATION=+